MATISNPAREGEYISLTSDDPAAVGTGASAASTQTFVSALSSVGSIISVGASVIGGISAAVLGGAPQAALYAALTKVEENDAVAARIMNMTWGKFNGKPACLIGVEITLNPGSRRILKTARFTLGNLSSISGTTAYISPSRKPRIILWEPISHEGPPVTKAVKRGGVLEPKANILSNEIGIGSLTYNEDFERTYRGTIQAKLLAGDDGNVTGVTWALTANKAEASGVQHMTNVALLVQHGGEPFTLEFSSQPLPPENRFAFGSAKK